MELYRAGNLAKSLAGHDRDEIYVIVREKDKKVYLADGKKRLIDRPKCKSKKHIQPIYYEESAGYLKKESFTEQNKAIQRAIRQYQGAADS